jgi:hypothetical protein
LDAALDYLFDLDDPTTELRWTLLRNPDALVAHLRERVAGSAVVREALASQRSDGSWGGHDRAANRLLPTLWMTKTLGELGLDRTNPCWLKAVEFLVGVGHTDGGVFSIWGSRDGVLSCYVGIAALLYLNGGLDDLAQPQLDWVTRYQEIKVGGRDNRSEPVDNWGPYLKTKYGGCMAETTCLVGLLREGRALAMSGGPQARRMVEAIRGAFLEREVMYTSSGSYLPLAVAPEKADSWLVPSFPLDWRVDLIEVVDFLTHAGPADTRMQKAVDKIAEYQLPGGTWPLRRTYRPEHIPGIERPSTRRSSPMITMRVVEAFWPLMS